MSDKNRPQGSMRSYLETLAQRRLDVTIEVEMQPKRARQMRKSLAAVALLMSVTITANAEPTQYLCLVEQASGLHYDKQSDSWRPWVFDVGLRYILRRLNDDDRHQFRHDLDRLGAGANWVFMEFGKDWAEALCSDNTDKFASMYFICREVWSNVNFDPDSRRFEIIRSGGYRDQGAFQHERMQNPKEYSEHLSKKLVPDPDRPADLYFEIGHCSSF
jgi:hypothetical protein